MPLPPVTGVNEVAALFCVRAAEAMACVAVTAALTVRLKVLVAVTLLLSVTVTVYVVAFEVTVGVLVMPPVLALKVRPVGSAGLIEYLMGATPPMLTTGVKDVAALFCVRATEAMDCVAER